jgi:HD-GYP domain-containing protein (c-di-GMP phosphodiesterase class II)
MTTDRPYRRALPEQEARAELLRCRGTHFDPQVVDALVAVLDT